MKRIFLLVTTVLVVIFSSACGTSAPIATQAPASQSAATEASTAPKNENEVTITLEDNTITSSLTEFKVGVPYTFVITNAGMHSHNFNIAQPVSVTGTLGASLQSALLAVTKSELGSGAQVTVQFTFPETATTTQLEFSCLIQRHYDDGMFLPITVTN